MTISNIKVGQSPVAPSSSSPLFSFWCLPGLLIKRAFLPLPAPFSSTGLHHSTSPPLKTVIVPIGTHMRAVVNVNINLHYLPYTVTEGLSQVLSQSLIECDNLLAAVTGYSIVHSAESFYRYYYADSNLSDGITDNGYDNPSGSRSSDEAVSSGERRVEGVFDDEEETFEKSFHDEISWFIPLQRGKTLLVTILQVDLGSDIPIWAAQAGIVSNAVSKVISLQKIVKRKRVNAE